MLKRTLIFGFVMSVSLAFGQLESNSVSVTASQSMNLPPDQVLFGVYVTASINSSLDDVLAALKGSGITIANLSGVGNASPIGIVTVGPPPTPNIQWSFSLAVPFAQMKATVTTLTSLQQSNIQSNRGFALSFSVQGTQVSASAQQSQVCSITGLIADATAQAQKLASAAGLNLGSILAMSSGTSNAGASFQTIGEISSLLTLPQSCTLTVKFAVTRF
jgi:Protein of unknown function (DUF541)